MNKCTELRKYAFPDPYVLVFFFQNIRNFLTPCIYLYQSVLPKGRSFTENAETKFAVPSKSRYSCENSGTNIAVLLGINRCSSFPLLSAPHSLFSIWTGLKRSEKIPRALSWRWEEWIWLTGPSRFHRNSTGVKISVPLVLWPNQRSANPNHSLPLYVYTLTPARN